MNTSNTNNKEFVSKVKAKMEFPLTDSMFTLIGKPDKVLPNGRQQYRRARLEKWVAANPHLVQNVRLRREKTPLKHVELALARERVERRREEQEQEREEALRRLVEERRPQNLRLIQTFALDGTVPPSQQKARKMVKHLVEKKPTDALILDYFLVFHSNYEEVEEQLSEPERYGKRRDPFVELLNLLAYAKVMKRIGLTRSVWPLAQSYFRTFSFVFYALPALEPLRSRLRTDPPRDLVRALPGAWNRPLLLRQMS